MALTTRRFHCSSPDAARKQLRQMLETPGSLMRLVGAHNALGAKLVEAAGFDGVWASSLEISASQAVPDTSILSMSEMLAAVVPMAEAVSIPIVADCDTGFGGPENVARMVRKYEDSGIAAVCIEDARFPKRNSLLPGEHQLADTDEFVEKIAAAKSAKRSQDFVVIARVEALIAGCGQRDAMRRAQAYAAAGADAMLIHSKSKTPDEVVTFSRSWRHGVPLVIVPTTYSHLTERQIRGLGNIRMVIYANHCLRAAITSMRRVLLQIQGNGRAFEAERWIAPVADIFEIQGIGSVSALRARNADARMPDCVVSAGADELPLAVR
jgi:phosphoenolpyruvate phosphomutase